LCRLGGGHDLVMNVPLSNRVTARDHMLVANLSMLTHLRIAVSERETTREMMLRVRDITLKAMKYRHYDYPALSEAVAREGRARGGRFHWMVGCSYTVDRQGGEVRVGTLLERINGNPPTQAHIPRGTFALSCRHESDKLHLSATWDHATWPVSNEELPRWMLHLLEGVTGPELPISRVI
jgi:hypothetical protein